MEHPPNPTPPDLESKPGGSGPSRFPWLSAVRGRIISGLIFALPIAITIWVVYWIYTTLQGLVLDPLAWLINGLIGREWVETLPPWWREFVSPLIALVLALTLLYFLGLFGRSRLRMALDWILLRVPIVSVIFKSVRQVFLSLEDTQSRGRFKRVVMVPFPSREVRSPAFVTRSMRDQATGRTILCVYVPYAPIPTTGLILLVPEDEVSELNWDVNDTMQAVISFGISTPGTITFDLPSDGRPAPSREPAADRSG